MKTKTITPNRLTLRGWAILEDINKKIADDAGWKRWQEVSDSIFKAVSLTTNLKENMEDMFWMDVVEIYNKSMEVNSPTIKFPVMTSRDKSDPMPWEYEGRSWYFWLNLFAGRYGWTEETVGALDIDTCIGLYQEILIDEQMEQEWDWGLSEMSQAYDKSSKKSRFVPLTRPSWMMGVAAAPKPPQTVKIHKSMMPQGIINSIGE